MALKILTNGQYVIKSKKQAIEALQMMQTLKDEIEEIRKDHGLGELEQDATELKKAVTAYCSNNGIDRLDFAHDDAPFHGTLVAGHDTRWILSKDDLVSAGQPKGAKSLRAILRAKLSTEDFKYAWAKVTKRVVNPEGIDELVTEGMVSENDVAPALVEKPRTPYLRIYQD